MPPNGLPKYALICALMGSFAGSLGLALAWHYPLSPLLACLAFVILVGVGLGRSPFWLLLIPAALPVIDLAPWSGWLTLEEFDLLVLALACGVYLRLLMRAERPLPDRGRMLPVGALLFIVAFGISIFISLFRGFDDAGGFSFGWFQGYDGPMNSLRIGKSFLLAGLLLPALLHFLRRDQAHTVRWLGWGLALGLGTASLAALVERLAYTGLLNFSADYRSTALFWEMHVGGAALDGWLLLSFPFAVWACQTAKGNLQRVFALGLLALGGYASLTTFSRGVYLGLAASMLVLGFILWRRKPAGQGSVSGRWQLLGWSLVVAWFGLLVSLVFPVAGYRGLIAILGLVFVMLALPGVLRVLPLRRFALASVVGFLGGSLLVIGANFLPKGPYILYAGLLAATLYALHRHNWRSFLLGAFVAWAGFVCLALAALNVAGYWGGVEALYDVSIAVLLVAAPLILGVCVKEPLWPVALNGHLRMLGVAIVVSGIGALFLGGAYMGDRFSTSAHDLDGRLSHWRLAASMLQSPFEIAFGKGLGRFPANFHFAGPRERIAGTYGINDESGNGVLSLASANHPMSPGDILRISQRLGFDAYGPFALEFKARAKVPVQLHTEVCEKHLLYQADCLSASVVVKPGEAEWNSYQIKLGSAPLGGGSLDALKFKMFSVGAVTHSAKVDIDDVALYDFNGANLLSNGDFSQGMARWFMTSDRDHMPWHAKNLAMNLLVDQGFFGLLAFVLLTAFALWHLNYGRGKKNEISPYLTASLIGFLVVSLFDSLLDVPRLAFAYYFLVLFSCLGVASKKAEDVSARGRA